MYDAEMQSSIGFGFHTRIGGTDIKTDRQGHLGGSVVEHLPLAQVVIPGSWDRVLPWVPRREPAPPSACVSASLYVSLMNK